MSATSAFEFRLEELLDLLLELEELLLLDELDNDELLELILDEELDFDELETELLVLLEDDELLCMFALVVLDAELLDRTELVDALDNPVWVPRLLALLAVLELLDVELLELVLLLELLEVLFDVELPARDVLVELDEGSGSFSVTLDDAVLVAVGGLSLKLPVFSPPAPPPQALKKIQHEKLIALILRLMDFTGDLKKSRRLKHKRLCIGRVLSSPFFNF